MKGAGEHVGATNVPRRYPCPHLTRDEDVCLPHVASVLTRRDRAKGSVALVRSFTRLGAVEKRIVRVVPKNAMRTVRAWPDMSNSFFASPLD